MSNIIEVSEATFDRDVLEKSFETPVVVDFWAPWCGPCRMLGPLLERLASDPDSGFILAKVNVDEAQSAAIQYGVQGIPAVKAFRNGQVVDEFVGAQPEPQVRAFLERVVPDQVRTEIEEAAHLLAAEKWAEAEARYRALPDRPKVHLGLAEALLGQGKGCEAHRELEAIVNEPALISQIEWLQPLADYLCEMEQVEDSEEAASSLEAQYRHAARLIAKGNMAAALDGLLELLREDKQYRDGAARSVVLGLFALLGDEHPLTRQYRSELAMVLF